MANLEITTHAGKLAPASDLLIGEVFFLSGDPCIRISNGASRTDMVDYLNLFNFSTFVLTDKEAQITTTSGAKLCID